MERNIARVVTLRDEAQRCRRLIQTINDHHTIATLEAYAAQLEDQAVRGQAPPPQSISAGLAMSLAAGTDRSS